MNEELMIKVKVDTSALSTTINKLKNEVSNVNKTINSMGSTSSATSKSTSEANKNTNKLSQAIGKLTAGMQKLKGINFGNLATTVGATTMATARLEKAVKSLQDTTKKTGNPNQGSFRAAFQSLNPNSALYEDVEWEGMDAAWENFNANMLEGISSSLQGANVKVKNFVSSIKNFKLPKSFAEFKSGLAGIGGKIGNSAKGTVNGISGAIKGMAANVAAAGAALTAFIAVIGLFIAAGVKAALTVSKLGNEIYHSANKFGFSTTAYQEWSYIMERNGSTIEDLKGFLETLASEQAAVVNGSEDAIEVFKELGLTQQQVASMGQEELFSETVKRLQGISDATKKSAIAYTLFGDEASRLMNVLNMSSTEMQKVIDSYHLLGGAMSDDLISKSNGLQNSIANMKQAWQGISNTMAQVFIPIVQAVVKWLTKAFVVINLFLKSIFGLDLKTKSSSGSMNGATSSTNKYAQSAKSATKAAEELKRVTMGFDELNIVQDPNKGSAGAGAAATPDMSGIGAGFDSSILDAADLNLEGLYAWFEKYKTLIQDIVTWSLIVIGVALAVIGFVSGNIPLGILGLGLAGVGLAIGSVDGGTFDRFLSQHQGLAKALQVVWEVVKNFFIGVFTTIWEKVKFCAKTIYEAFIAAWEIIKAAWSVVSSFFLTVWKTIEGIFAVVEKVLAGDFKGAWEAIKGIFSAWGSFFSNLWKQLMNAFSAVGTFFSNTFKNAWEAIKNIFSGWSSFFSGLWNGVKKIFGNIAQSIGNSIASVIKGAINAVLTLVEDKVNLFVSAINGAISIINKIPGVNITKLSKLSIPRLATGGIATRSTLANIGEAGREAVLPLENNTQWMDTLADKIAARNSSPSKIVLTLDGKELGWATINSINGITEQTGGIQLAL
jgi:phage-related protein